MIETIEYKNKTYPAFQASGNAARFILPLAQEFCKGVGYDVGCNRIQWMMPGSIPIDPNFMKDEFTQRQQLRCGYDKFGFGIFKSINETVEWCIDYDATCLPFIKYGQVDYIFSSHCLEHIETPWYQVLEYWKTNIKEGGVIFLYISDLSQEYLRPWNY